jgi:hypothetical protein
MHGHTDRPSQGNRDCAIDEDDVFEYDCFFSSVDAIEEESEHVEVSSTVEQRLTSSSSAAIIVISLLLRLLLTPTPLVDVIYFFVQVGIRQGYRLLFIGVSFCLWFLFRHRHRHSSEF